MTVADAFTEAVELALTEERDDILERLLDGMAEINPVVVPRAALAVSGNPDTPLKVEHATKERVTGDWLDPAVRDGIVSPGAVSGNQPQ